MNLEAERKAFIGEMAARVLTMGEEDFLRLKELVKFDRKDQIASERAHWFDTNLPAIREAMLVSQQEAASGRFVSHKDVLQKARKAIKK
jgi:hypothetical protein